MRGRSNSSVRLDFYNRMVQKTILKHQNPVTGLVPATPDHPHAWVRDNVYSILAVWGLALAYRKNADLDEDRAKAFELEQSVVKLMRGLLTCMLAQVEKVEKFKYTQNPSDSLHAKYDVQTGKVVVGDHEWGHLQLDATSLYLLILAEMTASGLNIIYSLDEVAFIQNLVFYIQAAYRTPDFGIWERGDKTNHGVPELNASSIGMTKAALEALNELDLFGARGGPSSVIHVMPDEAQQCQAILQSMLPRESNSKETDASLMGIISYPAFAVDDRDLINLTRETIIEKLQGRYGFRRFLRDGYKTPKEDPGRLHYELWELAVFENIECEWPMFFAYAILSGLFDGDKEMVDEYNEALDELMIKREDGMRVMPELYSVPHDRVNEEYHKPNSQKRKAGGKMPQMWGQSLYVLGRLLQEDFLSPGELDPLNRRLVADQKPDLVVQVVILAENRSIQDKLAAYDLKVQTFDEISPIQVYPARVLSHIFAHLGKNRKLNLTGRPSDTVGILATSRLYSLGDKTLAFFPQFVDQTHFYLPLDAALLLDMFKTDIQYLKNDWRMLGRPLLIFPIRSTLLDFSSKVLHPALVATIKKLQTGYINGTRVNMGNLNAFQNTSCMTNMTFLTEAEDSSDVANLLQHIEKLSKVRNKSTLLLRNPDSKRKQLSAASSSGLRGSSRRSSIMGIVKRSCSINVENAEMPDPSYFSKFLKTDSGTGSSSVGSSSPGSSIPTSPVAINMIGGRPFRTDLQPSHLKDEELSKPHPMDTDEQHRQQMGLYDGADCNELVEQLRESDSLNDQADIIHYLYLAKGPDWDTEIDGHIGCRVSDLLVELYDKASHAKRWWLVRHTAGMLEKRVEDLAKAATDILVRQKQLTVGLPPEPREKIITRPLPPDELASIIHEACGTDSSTAMLTQEILVYLSMYIRTEPKLFHEMLRIRVGLIIQVMASELGRTLRCSGDEASDHLLNLSPLEMKTLLHHILSGKEFTVEEDHVPDATIGEMIVHAEHRKTTVDAMSSLPVNADIRSDETDQDRTGQWVRRRRLDGSLNRVPFGFYSEVWNLLKKCHGLTIGSHTLSHSLTREMTAGEMKFAIQVEVVLNQISQPEYRQLFVEALTVLCLIAENVTAKTFWERMLNIDELVHSGCRIFIEEQSKLDGDVTLCCGQSTNDNTLKCGGTAMVCQHFYDSAPSGAFGTMSYLFKAATRLLNFTTTSEGNLDCNLS